ncbi:hypothetical protein ZIOFF_024879 [Zingiber officinale]|uniref:J domain-containing protein n=1 Tax=Zingiber officinale TaxID=94328 RepID=A0A8J5LDU6_ZINOF|nr:hypothetical protein ZIOFF_024879 [Zingiber officinale]
MSAYISRNVLRSREWSHRLPPIRCVLFHSSPTSLSRRSSDRSDSENQIRFSVRLKRSDARTAVRNICLNGTSSKQYIQKAKSRTRIWNESDLEEEDEESIDVRLQSHRRVLELPLTGPLTLDAIKSAFHAHALKWHPDKHGGPSQMMMTLLKKTHFEIESHMHFHQP